MNECPKEQAKIPEVRERSFYATRKDILRSTDINWFAGQK